MMAKRATIARRKKAATTSGNGAATRRGVKSDDAKKNGSAKTAVMSLRFSIPGLVQSIDAARQAEPVPLSRNTWIMRALVNELERQRT